MTEKKRNVQIIPARLQLAEFQRQDWVANAEFGTTVNDIMEPSYWSHVASLMKPYDHIEVRAEDGTWIAYLVVMSCDRTWARVALDREMKLTTKDVSLSQAVKHEIAWKGPQHKHAVIRLSDSQMIKAGFDNKEEARTWMVEHERTVG